MFVIISLLALLQYRLWVGDNSSAEYFGLKAKIAAQQQTNAKLMERNRVLKEEIYDLRSGTEALEERARNELGMVKQGETFFRVVDGSRNKPSTAF